MEWNDYNGSKLFVGKPRKETGVEMMQRHARERAELEERLAAIIENYVQREVILEFDPVGMRQN